MHSRAWDVRHLCSKHGLGSDSSSPFRVSSIPKRRESNRVNATSAMAAAGVRRVLVLAKRSAYDMYVARHQDPNFTRLLSEPQVVANLSRQHENESIQMVGNLQDRHMVHEHTVQMCRDILSRRQGHIQFEMHLRDELHSPIRDVDLVITVGGDGTLLQASHYVDSSIPVLGVNSDPTQIDEVEQNLHRYDASRSTGHLCAATANNFERMLDDILDGRAKAVELKRISTFIDGVRVDAPALNDILIAHPNPAAISRCSFSIRKEDTEELLSPVIHSRSSGLRISTATGSTAAMKSAGGTVMPMLSPKLQYMVREPNSPHPNYTSFLRGFLENDHALEVNWRSRKGFVYVDGSHLCYPIYFGCKIDVSNHAPPLRIFGIRSDGAGTWLTISTKVLVRARSWLRQSNLSRAQEMCTLIESYASGVLTVSHSAVDISSLLESKPWMRACRDIVITRHVRFERIEISVPLVNTIVGCIADPSHLDVKFDEISPRSQ